MYFICCPVYILFGQSAPMCLDHKALIYQRVVLMSFGTVSLILKKGRYK